MKSTRKLKITILIILDIFFAFLSPFIYYPSFITRNSSMTANYNIEFDCDNLQNSVESGRIHIAGNSGWVDFRNDGNCTGQGTYSDPYIIEDLEIDGGDLGSCILIEDSNVFFRIENCTVYNSGWIDGPGEYSGGIKLSDVMNAQIINFY